jgi:protein transport protein SEC24
MTTLCSPVLTHVHTLQVYSQRPPQPASYLFVIDVTHNSVKCGLVAAAAQAILSVLDSFPVDVAHGREHSDARIGIITFGGGIQFYNLTAGLGQPQMVSVTSLCTECAISIFLPALVLTN